jgi:UDP-N-acetylglucosamine--N-acetylmuramyl-(pentapeptide) pyrophosphoryl-undecaprenol N-acetylglucosamine transferase
VSGPVVLLAAGGTGGHLFPAEALAAALERRGAIIDLVTDDRALRYGLKFPARAVHTVPSETLRGRSPAHMVRFATGIGRGVLAASKLLKKSRPAVVVGFGGYPTVPPLIAARMLRMPTLVHEQNAVMGRANRLLARGASLVATGFPELRGAPTLRRPFVHVGNPVRPGVLAQARAPYPPIEPGGQIRLLVFGGSQGARVMADVVPEAIARLEPELRARLSIVQQAREEDLSRTREAYAAAGVEAELAPFISDMPARMAAAHLVIARSGASTVAELGIIGRPAVLVPFPHALDQDQLYNAQILARAGGAIVIPEGTFTPPMLAGLLTDRLADEANLAFMAAASASVGVSDAAERLADLVLELAGSGESVTQPLVLAPGDKLGDEERKSLSLAVNRTPA